MTSLFGVTDTDDEDEPIAARTWQDRVWSALASPRVRHEIRRIALDNGGSEPAADRYLLAACKAGTVVQVSGGNGNARYQRVDAGGKGRMPIVDRQRRQAEPRGRAAERTDRPAALGVDEGPEDDDDEDDEPAPKARLDELGRVRRVEVELGDEDDEPEEREGPASVALVAMKRKAKAKTMTTTKTKDPTLSERILEVLLTMGTARTPEIAKALGANPKTTAAALSVLASRGEIERPSYGVYAWKGKGVAPKPNAAKVPAPRKAAREPHAGGDAFDRAFDRALDQQIVAGNRAFDRALDEVVAAREVLATATARLRAIAGGA